MNSRERGLGKVGKPGHSLNSPFAFPQPRRGLSCHAVRGSDLVAEAVIPASRGRNSLRIPWTTGRFVIAIASAWIGFRIKAEAKISGSPDV